MFDSDRFVADCRAAVAEDRSSQPALREVVARTVANPADILRAFAEPSRAVVNWLYGGADITVLHFVWPPGTAFRPHEHRTWAVIGVYDGAEDNVFRGAACRPAMAERGALRRLEQRPFTAHKRNGGPS